MSELFANPVKPESTGSRLGWITVCLWGTVLLALHFYVLSLGDSKSQSSTLIVPILAYAIIAGAFYLVALPVTLVVMRRLPRAKGILVSLSIFYALSIIIFSTGSNTSRHSAIQAEQTKGGPQPKKAHIVNHVAAGNLQSNYRVGCISIQSAKNVFTPSDLYKGVAECMTEKNTSTGVRLNALAGVYGFYDTLRVSDKTSHQALLVLQMQAFTHIPMADRKLFSAEAKRTFQDEKEVAKVCAEIRQLGPPDYDPIYMIQHGMGAFSKGSTNPAIVAGFDQESSWEKALATILRCPSIDTSQRLATQSR